MRKALMSLVIVFGIIVSSRCSDIGKDGFNFYKDYLRGGRSDDGLREGPVNDDRMLYFYRTPLQLYPGLPAANFDQEHRKRTGNTFKNHMLSKELLMEDKEPGAHKSALEVMLMEGKHPYPGAFAVENLDS